MSIQLWRSGRSRVAALSLEDEFDDGAIPVGDALGRSVESCRGNAPAV